jgi:transposase
VGTRPIALGHHRYRWLHVVAFVQPSSGEAVWFLCNGLSKPFSAALLAKLARTTRTGREHHIVLVLDNAGWHGPEGLAVPEGISLAFLPPHGPELPPAERLWPVVDEPAVNRHFATLADLDRAGASPTTLRTHTPRGAYPARGRGGRS